MKIKILLFILLLLVLIPGLLFINNDLKKLEKAAISRNLENEIKLNDKDTLIEDLEHKSFEEFSKYVYELTPPNKYTTVHDLIYGQKVNWQGVIVSVTNNSITVLGDNNNFYYNNQSFSEIISVKKYLPFIVIVDLQDGISTQDLKPGLKIQVMGTLTQEGNFKKKFYWRIIDSTFLTIN